MRQAQHVISAVAHTQMLVVQKSQTLGIVRMPRPCLSDGSPDFVPLCDCIQLARTVLWILFLLWEVFIINLHIYSFNNLFIYLCLFV